MMMDSIAKRNPIFRKALREWTGDRNLALYYTNYFLFTIDSAKGDYLAAIKDLNVYYEIHDSIHSATKQHQLEELKITYATEQKDSLISLKEQNIQLLSPNKTCFKKANCNRLLFSGILVLLL